MGQRSASGVSQARSAGLEVLGLTFSEAGGKGVQMGRIEDLHLLAQRHGHQAKPVPEDFFNRLLTDAQSSGRQGFPGDAAANLGIHAEQ